MRHVLETNEGLGLLISLTWDRLLPGAALALALSAAGWIGSLPPI